MKKKQIITRKIDDLVEIQWSDFKIFKMQKNWKNGGFISSSFLPASKTNHADVIKHETDFARLISIEICSSEVK